MNKYSHNIKTILIGLLIFPMFIFSTIISLDQEVLKKFGINSAQAAGNILPQNTVFALTNKSGLAITANGFRTGAHPYLYAKTFDIKDPNQHFVWKQDLTSPEHGHFFINGTSKVLSTIGLTYQLLVSDFRENVTKFNLVKGPFQNSIIINGGNAKSIPIKSNNKDKIVELENSSSTSNEQILYYRPITGLKATIDDNITSNILPENKTFSLSTYSGLTFTVPGIKDNVTQDIIALPKNSDITQKLSWKIDSNTTSPEYQRGFLVVNNSSKVINSAAYEVKLKDISLADSFAVRKGFALNSYQILTFRGYSLNISKSGRLESKGKPIGTFYTDHHDLDQTFYIDNPNPNPLFKPVSGNNQPAPPTVFPSTKTTGNQPLIPTNYIFTMAARHGWGVDANKYKTSKTKRAFAYPRNKADPEQVIRWQTSNGINTGYLRLNGTDLTFVNINGFLTLQKYNGTESQRWDVKTIPGVNGALYLQDRSTKKVITINAENGYDVHVDPIINGDQRQHMVIIKN